MKKKLRVVLLLLLAAFFLIQFRKQPEIKSSGTIAESDFLKTDHQLDVETVQFLKQACYDCHSKNADLPWYAKVEPVGGWIRSHIKHGRGNLNFSDWANLPLQKRIDQLDFVIHEIETDEMPLKSYLWMHPEARLEKEKEERVLADLKNLLKKYRSGD